MSSLPLASGSAAAPAQPDLSRLLVLMLAAGAGLGAAALYYAQPLLGILGADLGASPAQTGLVPTLTQLGYTAGILLLIPLGDRYDRRRIILVKVVLLMLALLASALAPGLGALLVASLAIGLTATLAQDIVPAAAALAPEAHRGRTVGTVMTGLLLGILLSRVASGLVGQQWGWRAVFLATAGSIALIGLALWRGLPRFVPSTQLSYGQLMASLVQLWKRYGPLRRATLAQGLLSIGFSAFWSTLAVMLHERFQMGSAAAGAFGLAGAAGALAAPLAGRLADRRGPGRVTQLGAGLALLSFALLLVQDLLPPAAQIGLLVVAAIGFDFGVQATLVAHQTLVYSLDPGARSRLNALLFTGMFIGMAAGAALGSQVLAHAGWFGVVLLAMASAGATLAVRLWPSRRG
ncbi:MAG: MFS transporter [Gammaproteobacteria bacterium]